MHRPRVLLHALCLASLVTVLGCAGPPDPLPPADLRGQIASDLGDALRETNAAVLGTRDVLPSPMALALFERMFGIDTPLARAVHAISAQLAPEPTPVDVSAAVSYFNDRLFDDASYLGDGLYQVSPSLLCTTTATVDATCAAQLARLDLRIHTTIAAPTPGGAPSDRAVVFAIQLGADHGEPLTVTLGHRRLSLTHTSTSLEIAVDLDALQGTLGELAAAVAPGLPATRLSGHVTARLQADPTGASALLRIDRPISIKVAGASGGVDGADALALSSAVGKIFDIVLAQSNLSGSVFVALGETAVRLPARADGKRMQLDLAGLTAGVSLHGDTSLNVIDLGVGDRPATVSVGGARAATLEINPDDGHTFNVLMQRDEANPKLDTIQAIPRLDLRMTTDHALLGDASPVHDITRVLLDGILRTTTVTDRLEVTTGSYGIATDPASHGFVATAGQCVTSTVVTDPSAPPFVQWAVGSCQ